MSHTKKIVLSIVIAVVILLVAGLLFLLATRSAGTSGGAGSFRFPWEPSNNPAPATTTQPVTTTSTSTSPQGVTVNGRILPILYQLHGQPVAGLGSFIGPSRDNSTTTVYARYIERGLGHVFETDMDTLTETQLPGDLHKAVYQAPWASRASIVAIRQLAQDDTIKTFDLRVSAEGKPGANASSSSDTYAGTYLKDNILSLVASPDGTKFFALESTPTGGVTGVVMNSSGSNPKAIFSSAFSEWNVAWPTPSVIALTTKPSQGIPGHLYFLNPATGAQSQILSGIGGLTDTVSPDGSHVVFGTTQPNGIGLFLYDVKTKTSSAIPLMTFPDKCAWQNTVTFYCAVPQNIAQGTYPDDWYMGLTSFTDTLWEYDTIGKSVSKISLLNSNTSEGIDLVDPQFSPDGNILFFINKKDLTPWRLLINIPSQPTQAPQTATTSPSASDVIQ